MIFWYNIFRVIHDFWFSVLEFLWFFKFLEVLILLVFGFMTFWYSGISTFLVDLMVNLVFLMVNGYFVSFWCIQCVCYTWCLRSFWYIQCLFYLKFLAFLVILVYLGF
jgi:hypothetical protein